MMRLQSHSRIARWTTIVLATSALGVSAMAQVATQQGQGRGGAAGGTSTGTQQTGRGGTTQGQQGQTQTQPTQTRDTQTQTQVQNTAVISGMVVAEGQGTPVRRARVNITAPELRGGRSTITNDQGQFSFSALPAGRYTVTASKAGYIDIPYGAKRAGRPGTPIQLAAGQKMDKANMNLPKGGVITGVVVDDNGEPSPRTQVRAMKYVMRTGEKTLQQAGVSTSDDRGIYRIFGLQPGDYLVSAVPQNFNVSDIRQSIATEIETLVQQIQNGPLGQMGAGAGGGAGGGGGRGGGGGGGGRGGGAAGMAGIDLQQIMGGRGGGQQAGRLQQLQDQLAQTDDQQTTSYAPVYYPGTTTPSGASPVTLQVAEERSGVDFRLALVATAKVDGSVTSPDGALPQGTQISLMPIDQGDVANVPGINTNQTRVNQDGTFSFREIPPGRYRVMARGAIRQQDPNAAATQQQQAFGGRGGGRGGPGGPGGQISQVLWGSSDVTVNGEDVKGVAIQLQPGMTVTGRIVFDTMTAMPPGDLSTTRVNLSPRGQQAGAMDFGPMGQAVVDAQGHFTIKGVLPGTYTVSAAIGGAGRGGGAGQQGAAAGGGGRGGGGGGAAATGAGGTQTQNWILKSAVANNKDALDFGLVVEPNQDVTATILFAEKSQEVSGTIQDQQGQATADYTIILFASDKGYWVPNARRIRAVRPGTDGKFTFANLPAGDYKLTAVTDVEPGEWFDPNFLEQLGNASISVVLRDGEKKVQDIKVAGGGS
jgi:uncharacterized protein (DUF2141 family)